MCSHCRRYAPSNVSNESCASSAAHIASNLFMKPASKRSLLTLVWTAPSTGNPSLLRRLRTMSLTHVVGSALSRFIPTPTTTSNPPSLYVDVHSTPPILRPPLYRSFGHLILASTADPVPRRWPLAPAATSASSALSCMASTAAIVATYWMNGSVRPSR